MQRESEKGGQTGRREVEGAFETLRGPRTSCIGLESNVLSREGGREQREGGEEQTLRSRPAL